MHSAIERDYRGSKCLYIFFGGISNGVEIPPFEFYNAARILDADKIFVRDLKQAWYQAGLQNQTSNIPETTALLKREIQEVNPDQVMCVGGSMGGFASMLFAPLIGATKAVVFSPQTFISPWSRIRYRDGRWKKEILRMYRRSFFLPKIWDIKSHLQRHPAAVDVYYAKNHHLDHLHVIRLAALPSVTLHAMPGSGHNVVRKLRDDNVLKDALRPPM